MRPRRSPREVKQRLRALADRYTGAKVIHMRQDAVPWAYRVFSRQVGIDPDSDRTPVEAVAVERLRHGGLHSENLVDDALTIAIAETGVPRVRARRGQVEGELGPAPCARRRALTGAAAAARRASSWWPTIAARWHSCWARSPRSRGDARTREHMLLCALRVKGVPPIVAEEALWIAAETLTQ